MFGRMLFCQNCNYSSVYYCMIYFCIFSSQYFSLFRSSCNRRDRLTDLYLGPCQTSMTKGFYKSSKRFLTNNYLREKAVSLLEMKVLPKSVDNVLPTLKSIIAATLWQRSPNIVATLQRHNFMSALQRLFNAASTSLKLIFWCS